MSDSLVVFNVEKLQIVLAFVSGKTLLILDIHSAEEIAGDDVDGWSFRVGGMCDMITYATDEASAFYLHINRRGHNEFDAPTEGVDVDLLVLGDDGFAKIHADAAAESIEPGTMERLAMIDVFVAAIVDRAADTLAVLADVQRALQPLIGVATVAVDNQVYADI